MNDREDGSFCVHQISLINTLTSEENISLQRACLYSCYLLLLPNPRAVCGGGTTDYRKVHELLEASSRVRECQTFAN